MAKITTQFRNTALNLIIYGCAHFERDPKKDRDFVEGFCVPKIGNAAHECGGFELMEEGSPTVKGSLGGISFFQWTGMSAKNNRRKLFMAHCRKNKVHPYSFEAAISFMMVELKGTAKNVLPATMAATVKPNTPAPKDRLMARVVRFEELYERAGVKHYPSRYAWAKAALEVYNEWIAAGCPRPGFYIMPKARFSAEFDREFGSGEGIVTRRGPKAPYRSGPNPETVSERLADAIRSGEVNPFPESFVDGNQKKNAEAPQDLAPEQPSQTMVAIDEAVEPKRIELGLPPVMVRKGRWPEQMLSTTGIKAIQTLMRSLGYVRLGTVNGAWDSDMVAAVSKLQANAGIEVDGHYGPATLKALTDGVREVVNPERALATRQTLREAGEPTIKAAQPVVASSRWTAIGSVLMAPIIGAAGYFPQALSWVQEAKAAFADVPGWVWLLIVAGIALLLYKVQQGVQGKVVEGYREGAVTTTAAAVLPPGVTLHLNGEAKPWDRHATDSFATATSYDDLQDQLATLRARKAALRDAVQ